MDLPLILEDSTLPIYDQLYRELRTAIADQRLPPGTKLPASRALAKQLGVSRGTVVEAYYRLEAEGYLQPRQGSGTYISEVPPDNFLSPSKAAHAAADAGQRADRADRGWKTSSWAQVVRTIPTVPDVPWSRELPLYPGIPAYDLLPLSAWRRLLDEFLDYRGTKEILGYGDPAGYWPLRQAIAEYIGSTRAVRCTPDHIIITGGSQHALDLIGRVVLDPGDVAMVEDPGYRGARNAFRGAGAEIVPVSIDTRGFSIEEARVGPTPSLAYVTPSHQYPLGHVMDLPRRRELLRWASAVGCWIVEDDYDCEFRYGGRPLPAMQGMSPDGVIYVGTFSKVLFPSLRIGFMAAPDALVDVFRAAESLSIRQGPTLEQAVLARFIEGGRFTQHVRRVRSVYDARRQHLYGELREQLAEHVEVDLDEGGMHLVAHLPPDWEDSEVSLLCASRGVSAPPLSFFCDAPQPYTGLVLGYTGFDESQITTAVAGIVSAVSEYALTRPHHR